MFFFLTQGYNIIICKIYTYVFTHRFETTRLAVKHNEIYEKSENIHFKAA